jgi:DnaJ like chaperone protein
MGYRSNLGCLWFLLLILVLGGTPLFVGVLRVLAGFIVVAMVGGVALSWWIRRHAITRYAESRSTDNREFVKLLVALLVRLAELNGELDRREVTAIRQFFQQGLGYSGEQLLWIRDLIKESRHQPRSVASLCSEIAQSFGLQERFIVLQVLTRVASADGRISSHEAAFIEDVAARLGLASFVRGFADFASAGTGAGGRPSASSQIGDALSVLGLAAGASHDEVKQAWRKLSLENHPDRVAHLGEEFRRLAGERMRRINAAYETLKQAGLAT